MDNKEFTGSIETRGELEDVICESNEFEFEYEIDDIIGVFYIISNAFYENDVSFVLEIDNVVYPTFSSELSIFLESFLKLTTFVNSKDALACEFNFYEQGIGYVFKFRKIDEKYYALEFVDKKNPLETIHVKGAILKLNLILFTFYSRVVFLTQVLCPSISSNEMFVEWKASVRSEFGVEELS